MADPESPAQRDPAADPDAHADGRQVLLQKFFVKDASVEVPNAPQVFTKPWKPDVDVQVNTRVQDMTQDQWQVILTITVTAKLGDETAFLVEAHQAGVFLLKGFNTSTERGAVLGAYCPSLIFPFARETIADLVQRAGFPQPCRHALTAGDAPCSAARPACPRPVSGHRWSWRHARRRG